MASSFSTDTKLELIATGEKAGLWGTITNTNLQILEQSATGYLSQSMASGDVTLTLTNGATSDGKNAFYELTGTLTGNRTLIMPSGAERSIIVKDSTTRGSGSTLFSLSVQTASGTSIPIPINATVAVVSDGTNMKLGLLSKGFGTVNSASVTTYIAVAGDQLLTNTTTAGITITLPSSAATGDELVIVDARGTFQSNNLTIARNGHNINGSGANLILSTNGQAITLVYVDTTRGWAFKTNTA